MAEDNSPELSKVGQTADVDQPLDTSVTALSSEPSVPIHPEVVNDIREGEHAGITEARGVIEAVVSEPTPIVVSTVGQSENIPANQVSIPDKEGLPKVPNKAKGGRKLSPVKALLAGVLALIGAKAITPTISEATNLNQQTVNDPITLNPGAPGSDRMVGVEWTNARQQEIDTIKAEHPEEVNASPEGSVMEAGPSDDPYNPFDPQKQPLEYAAYEAWENTHAGQDPNQQQGWSKDSPDPKIRAAWVARAQADISRNSSPDWMNARQKEIDAIKGQYPTEANPVATATAPAKVSTSPVSPATLPPRATPSPVPTAEGLPATVGQGGSTDDGGNFVTKGLITLASIGTSVLAYRVFQPKIRPRFADFGAKLFDHSQDYNASEAHTVPERSPMRMESDREVVDNMLVGALVVPIIDRAGNPVDVRLGMGGILRELMIPPGLGRRVDLDLIMSDLIDSLGGGNKIYLNLYTNRPTTGDSQGSSSELMDAVFRIDSSPSPIVDRRVGRGGGSNQLADIFDGLTDAQKCAGAYFDFINTDKLVRAGSYTKESIQMHNQAFDAYHGLTKPWRGDVQFNRQLEGIETPLMIPGADTIADMILRGVPKDEAIDQLAEVFITLHLPLTRTGAVYPGPGARVPGVSRPIPGVPLTPLEINAKKLANTAWNSAENWFISRENLKAVKLPFKRRWRM